MRCTFGWDRAWGWQAKEAAQQHHDIVFASERPSKASPLPKGLDWDLWLGPAPQRPFNEVYFPGPKWYRWWDFGNGTMSDLGSHWNDLPSGHSSSRYRGPSRRPVHRRIRKLRRHRCT